MCSILYGPCGEILYVDANEPPFGHEEDTLSSQYCVKLKSNEVNAAHSDVFQSNIVATYEALRKGYQIIGIKD